MEKPEEEQQINDSEENVVDKAELLRQKRRKSAHLTKKRQRQREVEQLKALFANKTEEEIEQIREQVRKEKELKQKEFEESLTKGQRICIDASFGDTMSHMEQSSLLTQLSLCQKANRNAPVHVSLHVCGITPSTNEVLRKYGAEKWIMNFHEESFENVFDPQECIYMSPDGEEALETLDPQKVYIIGGIVDRTVTKNLSYNRAKSLSIPSYRLPIDKYVTTYQRPVLNVNTMVELFASYLHTNDWKVSFEACLPKRKQKAEKNSVHMDYHEIEANHIDIRTIQMNQLYQYQLKHCLHIYCVKKNIQLDIQNIDHCKGKTADERCECIIQYNHQTIGQYTTRNSRFAESVASYYALVHLEKEFGPLETKKTTIEKE